MKTRQLRQAPCDAIPDDAARHHHEAAPRRTDQVDLALIVAGGSDRAARATLPPCEGAAVTRRRASVDLEVEGNAAETLARAFWTAFGAIAAELLDDEDPVGEDLGIPQEAAA